MHKSTRKKAAYLRSNIFNLIKMSDSRYFWKPIAITLNIILFEFIVSRVYQYIGNNLD